MQDKRTCSRPRGTVVLAVRASAALDQVPARTADLWVVVQNSLFLWVLVGKVTCRLDHGFLNSVKTFPKMYCWNLCD